MTIELDVRLKEGLKLRPPAMKDAANVAELNNVYYRSVLGAMNTTPEEIADSWTTPDFDPADDAQVVETSKGQLVGYMVVFNTSAPFIKNWTYSCFHPDFKGQGVGTALTRWVEKRAREKLPLAPDDAQVVIWTEIYEHQHDARQLLENEGYDLARGWYHMLLELEHAPPLPQFPDGLRLTTHAEHGDLLAFIHAQNDAFKDHWGNIEESDEDQLKDWQHFIDTDPAVDTSLWLMALDGDDIAAMMICNPSTDEDPEMAYIKTIGVRRQWRKRGLGLAMLQQVFGELYRRGIKRVSLQVDATSLTNATRLYEKAGMHIWRRSDSYEKTIQSGQDLRTQSVEGE